jgi:hypothetical protein
MMGYVETKELEQLRRMRAALVGLRDDIDIACLDDGWSYVERINAVLALAPIPVCSHCGEQVPGYDVELSSNLNCMTGCARHPSGLHAGYIP